ncbi:MAG TPA: hypothetical protein VGV92_04010 [Gammaproteobacteria bacterium]|nr:hypothetical protein [Gammaproteobacteria bacterium]
MEWNCVEPPGLTTSFEELVLKIIRTHDSGPVYNDILAIRSQVYKIPLEDARAKGDEYSHHYCAYLDTQPVIVIRATQAKMGELDCEAYLPAPLITAFRNKIASTTRFCSINRKAMMNLSTIFLQTVTFDQTNQGMRLDLIDVREDMVRYYQRLGYMPVSGSFFIHPHWKTRSIVMLFVADLSLDSAFNPIRPTIKDPLTLQELAPYVRLCDYAQKILPKNQTCQCLTNTSEDTTCTLLEMS